MRRTLISLSLIGALTVITAACGSSNAGTNNTSSSPETPITLTTPASTDHNAADVTFAEQMIPHHQQALTMAAMALDAKAGASAAVKALATKIDAAQTPEINTMQGWLDEWTVPISTDTNNTHIGMDTSMPMGDSTPKMGGGDGMMSDADMHALAATAGTDFDKLWLTGMIAHHRGAITMATTEKQTGKNADARKLADSIASGQAAEVTEMQQLLAAG